MEAYEGGVMPWVVLLLSGDYFSRHLHKLLNNAL